jgi:hypothetical protein
VETVTMDPYKGEEGQEIYPCVTTIGSQSRDREGFSSSEERLIEQEERISLSIR